MDSYFDDERAKELFRRFATLLTKSGANLKRLIFVLRYKGNAATWLIDKGIVARATLLNALTAFSRTRPRWVRQAHGYRRSPEEIIDFAAAAGFEVVRIEHAGFGVELTRLAFLTKLDRSLKGILTRLDRRLHWFNNCTVFEFVLPASDGSAGFRARTNV
jgi:hypothetical protein